MNTNKKEKDKNLDNNVYLGFVAPLGTPLDDITRWAKEMLNQYQYNGRVIKISKIFKEYNNNSSKLENGVQLKSIAAEESYRKICAGDSIRQKKGNDILAKLVINQIAEKKMKKNINKKQSAFIIRQFKHEEEISCMRRVYGCNFFLLGIYASPEVRKENLINKSMMSECEVYELMRLDANSEQPYGQNTTKTFVLSDYFFKYTGSEWDFRKQLERFFDLIFSNIMITPTNDEFGMYCAYAAACRSGSISRQVGAAILSPKGELIATGHNDTPCYGGGLYGPEMDEYREVGKGFDYNDVEKKILIRKIEEKLKNIKIENSKKELDAKEIESIKVAVESVINKEVTEYGSTVHGEMEAILSCARRSVSTKDKVIYVTTFPCHNCARHIIAAGIEKVVYVEAYPKSKADKIHSDAYTLNEGESSKVLCVPFFGVSPRRYIEMFSLEIGVKHFDRKIKSKDNEVTKIEWYRSNVIPKNSLDIRALEIREHDNKSSPKDLVM